MKLIHFKFNGGNHKDFANTPMGWLAVGDHFSDSDGTALLSASCASVGELEAQANRLKGLIDDAVTEGKKRLNPA